MKKSILLILFVIILISLIIVCFIIKKNNKKNSNNIQLENNDIALNDNISNEDFLEERFDSVYMKINNKIFNITLEDNSATKEFKEKLKNGDITVNAHEYGGFEKVGNLGFSLPREDTNITTLPGDIVLYQGNQLSLFYNSNSWSYTKIGRIQNTNNDELRNILGNGEVTLIFTISK